MRLALAAERPPLDSVSGMSHTLPVRLRPRFEATVPRPPSEVTAQLREALAQPDAPCRGRVFGDHAVLYVLHADERIWSPFLSLDMAWDPNGTHLRGLFGPKPSVWSLFVASYALCCFGGFIAAGFAYAQWTLGQPTWALGGLVLALGGALLTWLLARYGQRRGRQQMRLLRSFLDHAMAVPVHPS